MIATLLIRLSVYRGMVNQGFASVLLRLMLSGRSILCDFAQVTAPCLTYRKVVSPLSLVSEIITTQVPTMENSIN